MINTRIIILGDSRVGKSCYLERLVTNKFTRFYHPTLGVNYDKYIGHVDKVSYLCHIWDASGCRGTINLIKGYTSSLHGAIIMFDVTNASTFRNIPIWLDVLKCNRIPIILLGNKTQDRKIRQVSFCDAFNYANTNNMLYYGIDVKENIDVCQAMNLFCEHIHTDISDESNAKQSSCCCCIL